MNNRNEFAARAMQAILSNRVDVVYRGLTRDVQDIAIAAFRMADAMEKQSCVRDSVPHPPICPKHDC